MGLEVFEQAKDPSSGVNVAAGIDPAPAFGMPVPVFRSFDEADCDFDCIVDFSHHSATEALTAYAVKKNVPLVIATTGQTDEEKEMIAEAAKKIPVFFAANFFALSRRKPRRS